MIYIYTFFLRGILLYFIYTIYKNTLPISKQLLFILSVILIKLMQKAYQKNLSYK